MPNAPAPSIRRPLTSIVRRRSWNEPAVRAWLLGALLLFGVAANSLWSVMRESSDTNWLIAHGTPVDATIFIHGASQMRGWTFPADSIFNFKFQWDGKEAEVVGSLPERTDRIVTGQTTRLHVDPDDVNHWTTRTIPLQWWTRLTPAIVLFVLSMLLLSIAALLRRQRLRWYEVGEEVEAVVVETRTSPIAPFTTAARCTEVSGHGRVITVYLPRSAGRVRKGDTMAIIRIPQRPGRALAAAAYAPVPVPGTPGKGLGES